MSGTAFAIEPYYSPRSSKVSWRTHYDGVLCTSNVVDGKVIVSVAAKELTGDAAQRLTSAIQHALAPT